MSILESNKQLCRDYFTAFLKRDTEWMKRHISPNFVRHDPGLPLRYVARRASRNCTMHCCQPFPT